LFAAYGPQHWWPGETEAEIVIGAVLTQNTAWGNVERAIARLKQAGCLSFEGVHALARAELEELIRPAGTFRVKAKRLAAFVDRLVLDHAGSIHDMLAGDLKSVRCRLTAIHGIGPETADAIILYAGRRPTFVVDAYTKRVLRRHFLIDGNASYETVRGMFRNELVPDPPMFNEYRALLVKLGKLHCRARARCDGCPLASLPHDPEP